MPLPMRAVLCLLCFSCVALAGAWETVGWLNYDKMLWEWCSLDEKDVKLALDWQLREGRITQPQCDAGLSFLEQPGPVLW